MKTLHYRWNRSLNWILTTLLGFLGFSSCEDNGDDPGQKIKGLKNSPFTD